MQYVAEKFELFRNGLRFGTGYAPSLNPEVHTARSRRQTGFCKAPVHGNPSGMPPPQA